MVMLAFVFGCANQQKEAGEDTTTKATTDTQVADAAVEEISITVTGMT